MKTVSTDSTSAVETPSITGFLSDDPHYRLTGHFKDEKEPAAAKEEAPPASTVTQDPPEIQDASATSEASKAAASATAPRQREEKKENRWEKRERKVRELQEKVARLEAAKPSPQTEVHSEPAQESQPATETRAKAAKEPLIDDVDPKTGKAVYASWKEFQKDHDKWNRQEAIREFQEMSARSAQETAAQRQFEERRGNLLKKFEAPRAKYADFDTVALSDALTIPAGSVAELFIHDSDHAGEVLYHLGKHPEILQGFYRNYDPKTGKFESLMSPQRQFRKLMEIEGEVSGVSKPVAAAAAASSSSARPAAQASQASPPPHQVDGKGTVAKDTIEQAVADGDTETYMKAQNARELARLKRK